MNKTDEKKKREPKTVLRRCLLIFTGIVVILAILLLGPVKGKRISAEATEKENLLIENIVDKLSDSLCSEDNRIMPVSTVSLSSAQIDALLATGIRAYQQNFSSEHVPVLFAYTEGSRIRAEISLPLCCGLAVNGYISVQPEIRDHRLKLTFSGIRAGWLPVPGFLVSGITSKVIDELEKHQEYASAMKVIIQAGMQKNGGLSMTFIPAEISSLIAILTK